MAETFAVPEIIQLAVNIEENGRDFYSEAAAKVKADQLKAAFKFLAGEEEKHIKVFQAMLSDIKAFTKPGIYSQEYFLYLKAFAGQNIFTKEKTAARVSAKINTDIEAIDFAAGFEKDSILFYLELKNHVIEDKKGVVDSLVEQEREHFVKLVNLKAELMKAERGLQ